MSTLASVNQYLTADLRECARCRVTQALGALRQDVRLRSLQNTPPPSLTQKPGTVHFVRDPRLPPDVHSEAELLAQAQAPWFCRNEECCVQHRIAQALKASTLPQTLWDEMMAENRRQLEPPYGQVRLPDLLGKEVVTPLRVTGFEPSPAPLNTLAGTPKELRAAQRQYTDYVRSLGKEKKR